MRATKNAEPMPSARVFVSCLAVCPREKCGQKLDVLDEYNNAEKDLKTLGKVLLIVGCPKCNKPFKLIFEADRPT